MTTSRTDSLRFPPGAAPSAHVSGASLPVVAVSRDRATVLLGDASAESLAGETYEDVEIVFGELRLSLPRVALGEVASKGDRTTGELRPVDDRTRAALWLLGERLSREAVSREETEVRTGVDAIPARGQYTEQARLERLAFLRRQSGEPLQSLGTTSLVPKRLTSNIENMIGSVEVPIGLAGPMLFHGEQARGVVYAPLATTEGTLVASAARGARAITRAGGVTTRVLGQRMTRVPFFAFDSLDGAMLFADWLDDHFDALREQASHVSRFAELVSASPHITGRHVHVPFIYETGDAAGQNMTTSCTWHACRWILKQLDYFDDIVLDDFLIDANMSGDKKVTFQSFLQGRGTRVVAEAFIDRESLERVLKVTPERLADTTRNFVNGAMQAGMIGHSVNVANIIAAMFMATGQDVGCVHESSLGHLQVELGDDGVHTSMLLPSLIVGTVGGGTHLPTQHELLASMGCDGAGKVGRFAEIIAGYCLALDLSTMAAIASDQFAHAHEKLGRNRPVQWFQREDLDDEFFETAMREALDDPSLTVISSEPLEEVDIGNSIITELTSRTITKLIGHFPYRVHFEGERERGPVDVMAKVKPIDDEVVMMTNNLASMCGRRLAEAFNRHKTQTDFVSCDVRELAVYSQTDERFTRHAPRVYGLARDDSRELFVVLMEYLQDVELLDSADDLSGWTPEHVESAITGIAQVHSIWYGRGDELAEKPWIGFVHDAESMIAMEDLWDALALHAAEEFPGWVSESSLSHWRELVRSLSQWWPELETHPKTLIHNDFNPRNICFRRDADDLRLCTYDWELATIGLPQRDLAELLVFVLGADVEDSTVDHYLEVHRRELSDAIGEELDPVKWHEGYRLSLSDLLIQRFGLYLMAHTFRHYRFMERSFETLMQLLELERRRERGAA